MALRNEDYRQLSAFYANPDKYIENVGRTAAGRGEYDRYQWKDNAKTLKKAIGRFYEETGKDMDEGPAGDIYFRGGLSLDGVTGESWAKGTNSFFNDFASYDRTSELIKENNAKQKSAEPTPTTTPSEEKKEPTPEILEAVERVKSFADKRSLTPGSDLFGNMMSDDRSRFDMAAETNPFKYDAKIMLND